MSLLNRDKEEPETGLLKDEDPEAPSAGATQSPIGDAEEKAVEKRLERERRYTYPEEGVKDENGNRIKAEGPVRTRGEDGRLVEKS